ncbi:SDR family NAD(P)-dependent oxidoreductase [Pseudonocardia abyssalis]|uniref:SDR family NAD(P)-dependent oxidoreductase n=1 Tax=Pseudonocardia abyssalis TaxID=2792008 RepID=A0ABS6UQF8_9PSEU|nr:SDR family NAD(P)-dependent oxidoreductase [Pseudonocardia abyssalis]MBW0117318.1 SDR family NAD(P)-dependent oxidoreductase [Pseudonocardia abyssalis]MBW0134024.1 SDR family NAD(P)-dependent oxidoreductase [Pseudonocardia abyssalis]
MIGRTALVTGVSSRRGIGVALARRLLADGHRVVAQSLSPNDATEPWGADPIDEVVAELGREGSRSAHAEVDLADPAAPAALVAAAVERFGELDTLVVDHARCCCRRTRDRSPGRSSTRRAGSAVPLRDAGPGRVTP